MSKLQYGLIDTFLVTLMKIALTCTLWNYYQRYNFLAILWLWKPKNGRAPLLCFLICLINWHFFKLLHFCILTNPLAMISASKESSILCLFKLSIHCYINKILLSTCITRQCFFMVCNRTYMRAKRYVVFMKIFWASMLL